MLGIIAGTGCTQLNNLEIIRRQVIRTPYGEPSGALTFGRIKDHEVVFLARHGYGHHLPPHEINYRANIWALREQGVENLVAVATVGGIREDMQPGVIAIPDQILDYTHGRKATYYEGGEKDVVHIDFTDPYCEALRQRCMAAARKTNLPYVDNGVYAAVQGPRLETAAEINRLERDGATMVGMTGMPEAVLARELGLCYAAITVVANHAAGRSSSQHGIQFGSVDAVLCPAMEGVRLMLEQLLEGDGD
ncbi:MAG: S-methyl-5'-thioinosine phosphorylase [Sulfuricella sp.]|nr:S-methyl-5'-thioinosine phosphorylase [Sulfuricella sp.]